MSHGPTKKSCCIALKLCKLGLKKTESSRDRNKPHRNSATKWALIFQKSSPLYTGYRSSMATRLMESPPPRNMTSRQLRTCGNSFTVVTDEQRLKWLAFYNLPNDQE